MKKPTPITGIVMILLIILRVIVNANPQLVYICAFINLIALVIAMATLAEKLKTSISTNMQKYIIPEEILAKKTKCAKITINWSIYFPATILCVLFLFFAASELGNDIISIVALGLSLADDWIIAVITDLCVK